MAAIPPAAAVAIEAEDARAAEHLRRLRRYARTRFGDIAYCDQGNGPVALFIHGFPLNGFHWHRMIARVGSSFRCLAPDMLGLGYTRTTPGQSVAPIEQVAMLAAFLDRLAIDRVNLVANDSGGSIAQLFAARFPDRVRSLLLTNCDVEPDSPPKTLDNVIARARDGTFADTFLAPMLRDRAMARSTGLGGGCYSKPEQPTDAALDYYLSPLLATAERRSLTNAYAAGLTPNPLAGVERSLRRLKVPVRIVWGMSDAIFSPGNADYLDQLFPGSLGVRRVPDGRLFFAEEYPDIVAEEARRLWVRASD